MSQLSESFGAPFVENFTKKQVKQVKQDLKIFDISQDKNGELYFANPGSLLEYDGFSVAVRVSTTTSRTTIESTSFKK